MSKSQSPFAERSDKVSDSMIAMRAARGMSHCFSIVILLLTCGALAQNLSPQNPDHRVRNIVLVHGAWADGSGWKGVYDIRVKDGYNGSIVQEPAAKFGMEGFSESLSKEVGPLGIKVTIVEPGGFRTDFAGSSTELREGRPEYDATVGATVRFQRDYDGKQPGDPIKAAEALLYVASLSEPPLRLLLGSDAYNVAEQHVLQILGFDKEWKDLSISTDYKVPNFV